MRIRNLVASVTLAFTALSSVATAQTDIPPTPIQYVRTSPYEVAKKLPFSTSGAMAAVLADAGLEAKAKEVFPSAKFVGASLNRSETSTTEANVYKLHFSVEYVEEQISFSQDQHVQQSPQFVGASVKVTVLGGGDLEYSDIEYFAAKAFATIPSMPTK